MRILFVAGAHAATVFALAPLATALRADGHQVFMASTEPMMPVVAGCGLPGVPVAARELHDYIAYDREGKPTVVPTDPREELHFTGAWMGRLAADSVEKLYEFCHVWRPDLVIGGMLAYAAPLLATRLGVPYVRHIWDLGDPVDIDAGASHELAPELARAGVAGLLDPDLGLDITPPSLRGGVKLPGTWTTMRWTPGNAQRAVEPWMVTCTGQPRVLVTSGSRVTAEDADYVGGLFGFLRGLVEAITSLEVDIVVAAPDEVGARLRKEFPNVRAGWVPLDVVAPTCDVMIHHAGGVTAMTGLHSGVPQILIPKSPYSVASSELMASRGAAEVLLPHQASTEAVAEACARVLSTRSYAEQAHVLKHEIRALPGPATVVPKVVDLVELGART